MGSSSIVPRSILASAFGLGSAMLVGVACYGATEVRVDVTTDLPCAVPRPRTAIRLGTSATDANIVADTTTCTDLGAAGTDVGTIVLVPSGARDARVTVEVALTADGSDPELCRPDANDVLPSACVVARRSFAFISHTSRALPIRLYAACRGKSCKASETCGKTGACESAEVAGDTGCIASECNGGEVPDAAPPPDAADVVVPPIDAGPLSCLAPDGTATLTNVPEQTDRLAANSTRLFWIGVDDNGTRSESVRTLATKKADAPSTLLGGAKTITALAADEQYAWFATNTTLFRYDLSQIGNVIYEPTSWPLAGVTAIATTRVKVGATLQPTSTAYVTTYSADFAQTSLYAIAPGANTPALLQGAIGGMKLALAAAGAAQANVVNVSPASGATTLYRHVLPWTGTAPTEQSLDNGAIDVAAEGDAFFFTAGKSPLQLWRFDDAMKGGPAPLYAVPSVGPFAVDGSFVYYAQRGPGGGILRGRKTVFTLQPAAPAPVTLGVFGDVWSPVLDDECVYFWSTISGIVAQPSLTVLPKVPR